MSIFIINSVVKDFKIDNYQIKNIITEKPMIMKKVQMTKTIIDKDTMVQNLKINQEDKEIINMVNSQIEIKEKHLILMTCNQS